MTDITVLLEAAAAGDRRAATDLLPLVYAELRELAAARMANEAAGHTLDPTALVHEAYLRLVPAMDAPKWDGRGHFFAAAAEAMRRILIDVARRKKAVRHGGDRDRVPVLADLPQPPSEERWGDDLLAVDAVLDRLTEHDPVAADLVKLHVFAGLPLGRAAATLGLSARTGFRTWAYAKAWMLRKIAEPPTAPS